MRQLLTITVPAGIILTANQRLHWRPKADRTKALRAIGRSAAQSLYPIPDSVPVAVHADVWKSRGGRYDPANLQPTAKALIDGWVDAKRLVDDDHKHLDGPHLHHGGVDRALQGQVRFDFTITDH